MGLRTMLLVCWSMDIEHYNAEIMLAVHWQDVTKSFWCNAIQDHLGMTYFHCNILAHATGQHHFVPVTNLSHHLVLTDSYISPLVELWDGILEGRIKLHKSLCLTNSLPQASHLPVFLAAGGDKATSSMEQGEQREH